MRIKMFFDKLVLGLIDTCGYGLCQRAELIFKNESYLVRDAGGLKAPNKIQLGEYSKSSGMDGISHI